MPTALIAAFSPSASARFSISPMSPASWDHTVYLGFEEGGGGGGGGGRGGGGGGGGGARGGGGGRRQSSGRESRFVTHEARKPVWAGASLEGQR